MNLGILLWNTCNAACSHCAVSSGPKERGGLTDDQILGLIDSCFEGSARPSIGLSGGEAFLQLDRLLRIIEYATSKGAVISVNTNGFWGTSLTRARQVVRRLIDVNTTQIIVSTDSFHEKYVPQKRVLNVIRACKIEHLPLEVQFVATKTSPRLADFLKEAGDVMLNVTCREIPCHPVGRATTDIAEEDLLLDDGLPTGLCPNSVMSVSAAGDLIPCCNTAGHLPSLRLGRVGDSLTDRYDRFRNDPLFTVLLKNGPAALVPAAEKDGFEPRSGYVDQCHLCHDLFRDPDRTEKLRAVAVERVAAELYASLFPEPPNAESAGDEGEAA